MLPALAEDATVRAATAAYTHMPPADHPRRVETVYRAETLEPATAPRTASSWETTEYSAQAGLGKARASTGYATRTTGKPGGGGVTIAIVENIRVLTDDPQSPGHPDLRDVSVVDISGRGATGPHATRVAGVAAARRNGYGLHGVAYNANLVSIAYNDDEEDDLEAIFASTAGLTGRYGPDAANQWDSNPAASAHIVNLSFSLASARNNPTPTLNGMKLLAREDRIMVAALGNVGGSEPAALPATAVANEGIAGWAIAVGMLDETQDAARSTSNRCGAVRRWCVFAPGDRIHTTDGTYFSTTRGFHTITGTSFATPHVAGALAAVWAAFSGQDRQGDRPAHTGHRPTGGHRQRQLRRDDGPLAHLRPRRARPRRGAGRNHLLGAPDAFAFCSAKSVSEAFVKVLAIQKVRLLGDRSHAC